MIGKLQPLEIKNTEISNVSRTKENFMTAISPVDLLRILTKSSFQLEQNASQQLVLLEDAQILQEADIFKMYTLQ